MKYKFILFLPGYLRAQAIGDTFPNHTTGDGLSGHRGTVMGDTFPNHSSDSYCRNTTFYYLGA